MKTIHHVVDMSAPVASAWSAITEADELTRWWSTGLTTGEAAVGAQLHWTFFGDFNPVMEITNLEPPHELGWRCASGHEPWYDNTFRFSLEALDAERTRLRFWQEYAIELDDDAYGIYNFTWAYYLQSLRELCETGTGKPFEPPA